MLRVAACSSIGVIDGRHDVHARAGFEQRQRLARRDAPPPATTRRERRSLEHERIAAHRNLPADGSATRNAT